MTAGVVQTPAVKATASSSPVGPDHEPDDVRDLAPRRPLRDLADRPPPDADRLAGRQPDGLEKTDGGFLVTSWAGTVLAVDDEGRVATLEEGFRSGADVARGRGRIAVPELLEGTLTLMGE